MPLFDKWIVNAGPMTFPYAVASHYIQNKQPQLVSIATAARNKIDDISDKDATQCPGCIRR
jgi:hypothetical protein